MTTAQRIATYFHVHLVSDSTGETLNAMAKAVVARFDHGGELEVNRREVVELGLSRKAAERAQAELQEERRWL